MHSQKHRPDGGTPETVAAETDANSGVTEDGEGVETESESEDDDVDSHLAGLSDGVGCTEIWEHLSEQREE